MGCFCFSSCSESNLSCSWRVHLSARCGWKFAKFWFLFSRQLTEIRADLEILCWKIVFLYLLHVCVLFAWFIEMRRRFWILFTKTEYPHLATFFSSSLTLSPMVIAETFRSNITMKWETLKRVLSTWRSRRPHNRQTVVSLSASTENCDSLSSVSLASSFCVFGSPARNSLAFLAVLLLFHSSVQKAPLASPTTWERFWPESVVESNKLSHV